MTFRWRLVPLSTLVFTSACVIVNAEFSAPQVGGRLAIGETFRPEGTWSCELGEQLVLTNVDGAPALHVASRDYLLKNHWEDERFHRFGMTGGWGGVVYSVPKKVEDDAFVDYWRELGSHGPGGAFKRSGDDLPLPMLRKFTGFHPNGTDAGSSVRPDGDPWMQDVCWSPSGPLVQAAKAKGARPRDLLYFGARVDDATPPAPREHLRAEGCLDTDGQSVWGLFDDLWIAQEKLWVRRDGRKLIVDEARPDRDGCVVQYAAGACTGAQKSETAGYLHFYWEQVQTGFLVAWQPSVRKGLLAVYAPGDLRRAPSPPEKTGIAGPLMPARQRAVAIMCQLSGYE